MKFTTLLAALVGAAGAVSVQAQDKNKKGIDKIGKYRPPWESKKWGDENRHKAQKDEEPPDDRRSDPIEREGPDDITQQEPYDSASLDDGDRDEEPPPPGNDTIDHVSERHQNEQNALGIWETRERYIQRFENPRQSAVLPQEWKVYEGLAEVNKGQLWFRPVNMDWTAYALVEDGLVAKDFNLTTRVTIRKAMVTRKKPDFAPGAGVFIRVHQRHHMSGTIGRGIVVWLNINNFLTVHRVLKGHPKVTDMVPMSIYQMKPYKMKIMVSGESLRVWVDNMDVPALTTKAPWLKGGAFGLMSDKAEASFDYLQVYNNWFD
ncbi:hypothetical protein SODALDRAFT_324597 [Sodiomyces alkalinus F11]|uniref:Concanavalin A-like lectin/glucanase n=1 Tax=Sodiomyces alkalinus (strain CBS 110278 / VKM F-3762 / F11) TaxID=1314773 RepID=A0A3N2PUL1_SODAK|nr:hypothetical protein SODALDRAFT_324597 [Sodiomyces alkalinus F11]ROT38187.1 hypothetical protein SODALDRAFT_324597 [Sodiomyces alkalinus F11]